MSLHSSPHGPPHYLIVFHPPLTCSQRGLLKRKERCCLVLNKHWNLCVIWLPNLFLPDIPLPDSSVRLVARLRAGRPRIRSSLSGRGKIFSFLWSVGTHDGLLSGSQGSFLGCKLAYPWSWPFHASRTGHKNEWSFTTTPRMTSWCAKGQIYFQQ